MDCDDVMLALANRERTLTDKEEVGFHTHLDGCEECRALAVDTRTDWRWIARLPEDAFEGDLAMVLPTVDPIVFDIDQEIASGGMGRITKATDRRLGREVALKEVLDLSLRARFEREAMITARLQHPAIVPIYEAGTFPNGHPFYTMRLVWGGTLGGAIHQTTTVEQRLALLPHVIAVTEALAYAHSNRIIHRDLKPGNVLVGEFGETVVIDWGLAKDLSSTIDTDGAPAFGGVPIKPSSPNLTRVGSVLGTPGFMSPEQASGGSIDERADVYALGAILYNLLSGVPPYWDKHEKEGSTQLIAIGIDRPPTPIAEVAPDAPADLRTIVEKAMARRKEDRYPTAKEMAQELRRFAAGQLIAREYSSRELLARWIKKHRTAVSVGAIAAVALAVVVVLAFVSIARSRGAERVARQDAERAEQDAIEQRDSLQRTAAELQENEGIRELRDGDGSRAYAYLAAAFSPQRTDDPAFHYLLTAAARDLELLEDAYVSVSSPPGTTHEVGKAIAFVGDRIAIVDGFDKQLVSRRQGVNERPLSLGIEPIHRASFAPTGKLIALERTTAVGAPRVEIWDLGGVRRLEIKDLENARVAFDGKDLRIATAAGTTLHVHELAEQTARLLGTRQAGSDIRDVAINDTEVATCGRDGVAVWKLAKLDDPPAKFAADCTLLAFLDPGQLVIANKKYELLLWDVGKPQTARTMSGHIPINVLAVNKATQRIATGDATGVVMWNWKGDALGESRDITGGIDKLAFTPDGTAFVGAGADDRVFVWDTASFHLRQAFGGGRGAIAGIAIDLGGNRIASLAEQQAQIWKVPGGRLIDRVPSQRFAIVDDQVVTSAAGRLSLRSVIARDLVEQHIAHPFQLVELIANTHRITARTSEGAVFSVEPTTFAFLAPVRLPKTATLAAEPRFALDLEPAKVTLVDVATGKPVTDFPADKAQRAVLSPDGKQLAILLATRVERYAVATRQRTQTVDLPEGHNYDGRFDATGQTLVLYAPHAPTLVVDNAGSRTLIAEAGSGVVFSGDGRRLALGVGNTVQLWDLADRSPKVTVSSTIRDAYAIDRTGELLATGSVDGSVRIWDSRGRLLDRLVGSQTTITGLAFAAADSRLVAQSDDGIVSIWDVHVERKPADRITETLKRGPWKLVGARLVPRAR